MKRLNLFLMALLVKNIPQWQWNGLMKRFLWLLLVLGMSAEG
jgi:hypothetical protein